MSANINRRSLLPLFLLSHCRPSYLCAILPKMLLLSERQKLCGRGELKNWLLFLLSPLPLSGNFNKMSCWPPKVPFHKPSPPANKAAFACLFSSLLAVDLASLPLFLLSSLLSFSFHYRLNGLRKTGGTFPPKKERDREGERARPLFPPPLCGAGVSRQAAEASGVKGRGEGGLGLSSNFFNEKGN